jgi:exosome complex component CSL4
MEGTIVTPGEPAVTRTTQSGTIPMQGGKGTYTTEEGIFSSIVGRVTQQGNIVEVISKKKSESTDVLPFVGAVVTGKVIRVTSKVCDVQILCVGESPVRGNGFKGVLRKENVRAFEVDQLDLFNCFRMGDIITASVAALGGARSYELSTAGNHLGVIYALCAVSGEPMIPASWETMRCPITGTIEKRKVAKVEIK